LNCSDNILVIAEFNETISSEDPACSRANKWIGVLELREDVFLEKSFDLSLENVVLKDKVFELSKSKENTIFNC